MAGWYENSWKATVTMEDGQVVTHPFSSFDEMLKWMDEHHGEYSAFMAAEKKEQ